ncbi:exocyst complex component 8 [Stomoxys calcitrans]|uniref:exocyst complex component 8 n=1 Tax=Stomoxys calcitrans TaxID=35570 RepID=UPI0027E39CDD|nr:exocyst complex component 8 [Stomoxys calcitrans]
MIVEQLILKVGGHLFLCLYPANMTDIIKEFDNPNFSVEKYTKQLVKECVGGADLQKKKKEIQVYSDKTSSTLKKSVYANYMQFIETAKEISNLESEMTQLSLLLHDQHNILSSLTDEKNGVTIKSNESADREGQTQEEVENMHATRAVKEMVHGYEGNLEGKTFLNEGALTELDSNDYRPIQRVFFLLFNDVLIVCKVKHDKRLEFLVEYDPKKIAVINIKDLDGVKNAINIITPDGSKIFQSITAAGKAEWIEQLEVAFRWDQQQKKAKKGPAPQPPKAKPINASTSEKSLDISPTESTAHKVEEQMGPEWIQSATDEIQTFIAQRHFEEAEALIKRCQEFLGQDKTFKNSAEIEDKIKQLEKQLTDVLLQELSKCHARNLQVALRSSRRSLQILVDMGKARQACGTLLKVCSIALRTSQREARKNNAEISELFFCDLAQVASAFLLSFDARQPACVSALVVWCNAELQYFAGQLKKHYLTKGSHLEAIAKCMEGVRKPCAKLTEIGLDLQYHLEGLLRADLEELINESRIRLLETIGRTEDPWQPFNLQTKSNLKRLLMELDNLGIDMRPHTTGDTWVNLTQSTLNFTRHYLQLTNHCAYLSKSEALSKSCQCLLKDLITAQYSVKPDPNLSVDPNFVIKNKQYLSDELLPIAISNFRRISGINPEIIRNVDIMHKQQQAAPIPKKRSVYQTDVF